jgi:hypothetical protein
MGRDNLLLIPGDHPSYLFTIPRLDSPEEASKDTEFLFFRGDVVSIWCDIFLELSCVCSLGNYFLWLGGSVVCPPILLRMTWGSVSWRVYTLVTIRKSVIVWLVDGYPHPLDTPQSRVLLQLKMLTAHDTRGLLDEQMTHTLKLHNSGCVMLRRHYNRENIS